MFTTKIKIICDVLFIKCVVQKTNCLKLYCNNIENDLIWSKVQRKSNKYLKLKLLLPCFNLALLEAAIEYNLISKFI